MDKRRGPLVRSPTYMLEIGFFFQFNRKVIDNIIVELDEIKLFNLMNYEEKL